MTSTGEAGSLLNLKLGTFSYGYDVKGNITGITETGTLPRARGYGLDAVQRLTKVTDAANSNTGGNNGTTTGNALETYTLDAEGNRIVSHKSTYHVTDAANRLQEDQTHAFEYDVNGNMVRKTVKASDETWRYNYTIFDELSRASRRASADPAAPELEWRAYGYDGFGRLDFEAGSTTPPVPGEIATSVLYQDGEHIVAEAKGTGFSLTTNGTNIVNWYTYSDATDDLLAITPQAAPNAPNAPNGGTSFSAPSQTAHYSVHTDHQGSVRAITDDAGGIVNTYAYDAYGNPEEAVESLSQPYRYTGREYDGVARIYHYRARAYDAETGRFLQEDPLGFDALHPKKKEHIAEDYTEDKILLGIATAYAGELNTYRYVSNNPVIFTDPTGLFGTGLYASAVKRAVAIANFTKRVGAASYDAALKLMVKAEVELGANGYQNAGGCFEQFARGMDAPIKGLPKAFKPNVGIEAACYGLGKGLKMMLKFGSGGS